MLFLYLVLLILPPVSLTHNIFFQHVPPNRSKSLTFDPNPLPQHPACRRCRHLAPVTLNAARCCDYLWRVTFSLGVALLMSPCLCSLKACAWIGSEAEGRSTRGGSTQRTAPTCIRRAPYRRRRRVRVPSKCWRS